MSKQKKKKKANVEAQLKLQSAQSKNEFKTRVKRICSLLGDESKFKLLEKDFDFIYDVKPYAIKVVAAKGSKVSPDLLDFVKTELVDYAKSNMIELYEGGPEVSLYEYHYIVQPIQMIVRGYENVDIRRPGLAEAFALILTNSHEKNVDVILKIGHRAEFIGVMRSNFFENFFHIRYILPDPKKMHHPKLPNLVEVRSGTPVWKQIRIGAGKRTAARVGWGFPRETEWMKVKPSQLGIKNPDNDRPMDVYILQHAGHRLYERIGATYRDVMNFDIITSLFSLRTFTTGGGNFLIEHRIFGIKAGYYAATITDGVLLIRTFLFLTHTGTPEGKKLAALTGLGKWDQKYLAFDNLLALANSDILSNEQTREIFRKAGCGGLLKLCSTVRQSSDIWRISECEIPVAEKMLQYIKSGKEEMSDIWAEMNDDEILPTG